MKKQNKGILALKISLYSLLFICIFAICVLSFEPTEINVFGTGFSYSSHSYGYFIVYNNNDILAKINYIGFAFNALYDYRYIVLAVSTAVIALIICLETTAPVRRHKKYKKGLVKTFEFYGEKYIQEDDGIDY